MALQRWPRGSVTGFGEQLLELRQVAVVVELGGEQSGAGGSRDGDAVVQELVPWPQPADPVAGVQAVQLAGKVALDLIPVVLDQVEDDVAFPACSSSTTWPQVRQAPSSGGFTPRPKWVLTSWRNASQSSGGPELAPGSTGLWDMPIQTNWGTYGYGQFFQSWKPKRRDVVWTIHVVNPDTGTLIDQDADLWHTVYSRWKAMFSPIKEAKIVYGSIDGERTLGLRTLDSWRSFSTQPFEGGDPHQWAYGSVVQTMAAELPFYVGKSDRFEWSSGGPGDFFFKLPYFNPSTVDIWAEWELSWGAKYQLPDYSFGSEIYGRGIVDLGKTVPTPEIFESDGNVTVFTRPDRETYISENETPVGNRAGGRDFEYPILPGEGNADPENGCTVRVIGATEDVSVILTLPRWYDTPFSTPLVV